MAQKISELTTDELGQLVREAVRETLTDVLEDLTALNSPSYLESIREARAEYKSGHAKSLDELIAE